MSYEEPKYTVVSERDRYEVRRYKNRTVAEVTFQTDNSGFRLLFDYISGANLGSKKLEMTVPVIQSEKIDYDRSSLSIKYKWQDDHEVLPARLNIQCKMRRSPLIRGFVLSICRAVFWGHLLFWLRVRKQLSRSTIKNCARFY